MQDYDWHHISMIIDEKDEMNNQIRASIERVFKASTNYEFVVDKQEFAYVDENTNIEYTKYLNQSRKISRG